MSFYVILQQSRKLPENVQFFVEPSGELTHKIFNVERENIASVENIEIDVESESDGKQTNVRVTDDEIIEIDDENALKRPRLDIPLDADVIVLD